jgi:hypothetical protein
MTSAKYHTLTSKVLFTFLALGFLFLFATSVEAASAGKGDLCVVKITDCKGELRYEVIEKDLVKYLKQEVQDEYKAEKDKRKNAQLEWKARYGKARFDFPDPLKPTFNVVAKGLLGKSAADKAIEDLRAKDKYCVVQVVQGASKTEPEVILKDEVKQRTYAMEMAYFESMKSYLDEKTAFEASSPGAVFEKEAPEKPKLKVLKNSLKSMDSAMTYLGKHTT